MQPFASVTARLTLTDELAAAFNGNAACYRGAFGSTTPCELRAEGTSIFVSEKILMPFENVTVAAGFAPGTFASPPKPLLERLPLLLWGGLASLGVGVVLTVVFGVMNRRNARTGDPIIAQYEPPEGLAAAVAAFLLKTTAYTPTVTLLDLAVRGNLKLLRDEDADRYGLLPITDQGLLPIEQSFSRFLFARGTGNPYWFTRTSTELGDAAAALRSRAATIARSADYVRKPRALRAGVIPLFFAFGLLLLVFHAVVLGNFTLMTVFIAVGANALVWVSIIAVGVAATGRGRTLTGSRVHDRLMGLREYIRLAEADRIRMLQSASGAEVDEQHIVQVYERLLPYAVLFGYEREWQAELDRYYRESNPPWVEGASHVSRSLPIGAFAAAVASSPVTHRASSSSGGSFSSRSSGSSGGGFSGGGGGGGGGRGI